VRTVDAIRRSGVAVTADTSIQQAAEVMDQAGIGALAVVDDDRVVGVVTDRDIIRRGIARRVDVDARVDAVMSSPPITIDADADLHDACALFRNRAVRRLIVERAGSFVGVLALDDLLVHLAGDLADLARPVAAELLAPHRDAPLPAPG
jgi:signal-transduction protein with cAMP-binding, CBS, and nucleotidyltransferase domain